MTIANPSVSSGAPPDAADYAPAARGQIGLIAGGGATLWSIYANSDKNQDLWLMLFDLAVPPINGASPIDFVQIPRRNNGEAGIFIARTYRNGIRWAASTDRTVLQIPVLPADLNPFLVRARYTL